ncbi:MAG: SAM-dependent methyltransferase [Erysipelotrichaceae bacterium]|nr:SAM-dependent methyltransferase [Erysipelotrichaceae bacterium]
MSNEAKTSACFRKLLHENNYYNNDDIIIEEQKSDNPKINKLLKNASKRGNRDGRPDFIISSKKYPDFIIVVELKFDENKLISDTLDNYADYAVDGALLYASFLSKEYDVLAIGVCGENIDKLEIAHYLHLKHEKNAYPIFDNHILTLDNYYDGYHHSNYKFNQDYAKLISYSKVLNEKLHAKKIKESQRALLISGILIALKDKGFKAGYKQYDKVHSLVNALYVAIETQLIDGEVPLWKISLLKQAYGFIKTNPTLIDEKSGKEFLIDLIEEIDNEINGFMITYQYVDTVSQFYIEFLRYANNDKGLGIVLTPPHITDLFVELADVNKDSIVFDNCCGTGGFLISAMKRMLIDANHDKAIEERIKNSQLIGIEYQDDIYALLISNMIIHLDGRTQLFFGDCFKEIETIKQQFKPTVGLLNPPYKTKSSDTEEFEFILNNLEALEIGSTCIAIVPISCVIEKTDTAQRLKKDILDNHTLEAVLSLPEDLFYNSNVNTVTCAIIITAKKPHPTGKKTWFAYCRDDGFVKIKNKGRIDANHTWDDIKNKWVNAYRNKAVIDNFSVMQEVTAQDEWCVEAFLETDYDNITYNDYENTVKKFLMFNMLHFSSSLNGDDNNENL